MILSNVDRVLSKGDLCTEIKKKNMGLLFELKN